MVHRISRERIAPTLPTTITKSNYGIHKYNSTSNWMDEIEKELQSKEKELAEAEYGLEKEELERERRLLLEERKEELESERERLELEKEGLKELEERLAEKIEEIKPTPPAPVIIKEEKPKEPIMPKIEEGLKKVGKVAKAIPEVLFDEKKRKKEEFEKFKKESKIKWV